MTSEDLVLVANIPQTEVDALREHPMLKKLHIVNGNYYEAVQLKRAAPERAKKVLILADRTPAPNGQIPSMTEVDARTIMTAMSLSSLARGTMIAAEILDAKMDQYLKIAHVTEIIYSREYSPPAPRQRLGRYRRFEHHLRSARSENPDAHHDPPDSGSDGEGTYGEFKATFETGETTRRRDRDSREHGQYAFDQGERAPAGAENP